MSNWVELTEEEIEQLADEHLTAEEDYIDAYEVVSYVSGDIAFARAIEAKLKEKNT